MIIETIFLSLLIGKLTGGKIKDIENLYIKGWYLFIASFLIEIIALLIVTRTDSNLSYIIESYFGYIHIIIYLLLILGLAMNWDSIGLRITLFGSVLNFLPIYFNSGRMPVSLKALKYSKLYTQIRLLEEGRIMTHVLGTKTTPLIYLGDIIPIPKPYVFPKIISIGDIFMALGLFILIQVHMKSKKI